MKGYKSTNEEFIKKARKVHGDKYDYSKVNYVKSKTKVCIICPIHGEFWQTPNNHLQGQDCPQCGEIKRKISLSDTKDIFISKAKQVHGDRYDYSKVEYKNNRTKVCIICPTHGEFLQKPNSHLNGQGCRKCSTDNNKTLKFGVGFCDVTDYIRNTENEYSYRVWNNMLNRCYNDDIHVTHPTYKDCIVCSLWHQFSNFKGWFDSHYIDGWYLDKDILFKGNKLYSPDTCCFVPCEINNIVLKRQNYRGNYPIGVYKENGRFKSKLSVRGKYVRLGSYDSVENAFYAYKLAKENYIKELADKYKDQLEPRVYEALYNYQVEITD